MTLSIQFTKVNTLSNSLHIVGGATFSEDIARGEFDSLSKTSRGTYLADLLDDDMEIIDTKIVSRAQVCERLGKDVVHKAMIKQTLKEVGQENGK